MAKDDVTVNTNPRLDRLKRKPKILKDRVPKYKSIFDREDIAVNKEEPLIFDVPLNSQSDLKTRSNSRSRTKSRRNTRDRSLNRHRDSTDRNTYRNRRLIERSRSPDRNRRSTERGKSSDTKRRSSDRNRGSTDRSPDYSRRSMDRHRDRRSRDRALERRRSAERERVKSRRYSRERDATPKKTYEKHSESQRSHSRERSSYRERKKSLTPLRPGEYRNNHPDLMKRSRSGEKYTYDRSRSRRNRSLSRTRPPTSKKRSLSPRSSTSRSPKHFDYYEKRSSRSPQPSGYRDRKRYGRSPEYERYKSERGRSRSPRRKDGVPYRDPSMDFGYYEGIPDFWMHPSLIRPPGYPMERFHPPAFYPRVMPGGSVIYPPRHPIMPPIIRQRLPVYNSRSKPVVTQTTDKVTATDKTD